MNRSTAEKLMEALAWMEVPMNRFEATLREIDGEGERRELGLAIGEIMGRHFSDVMIPILRQYPDLDPERMGRNGTPQNERSMNFQATYYWTATHNMVVRRH